MVSYASFLESKLFQLVLADPDPGADVALVADAAPAQESMTVLPANETDAESVDERPSFYAHKSLLASLSPELSKHIYNDMKEGIENVMILKEVDKATMVRFLEWAYTKDYQSSSTESSDLIAHLRVYVLADRFNVLALKELAYSRCTTLLVKLGRITKAKDVLAILDGIRYAFENLPAGNLFNLSGSKPTSAQGSSNGEKNILPYLGHYAAWTLDVLKEQPAFGRLLDDNPEFARAVVCNAAAAPGSPWEPAKVEATPMPSHVLRRKCGTCSHIAIAIVQCGSCGYRDCDIGFEVKVPGSSSAILVTGQERLTDNNNGTYKYRCAWCTWTCSVSKSGYGHLYCRKCNNGGTCMNTYSA